MSLSLRCVVVELIHLRWDPQSPTRISYRLSARGLVDGETAADAAAALAGLTDVERPRRPVVDVLHSTSWRQEPEGTVVLSYAALPDPHPQLAATPLTGPAIVCSGDPLRPAPDGLHAHHVAAHAVRHLADLAGRDPAIAAVAAAADGSPALWQALIAVAASVPTGTHSAAHAASEGTAVAS